MEYIFAAIIIIIASYFFYSQFKKKKNGVCGSCSSCSAKCPHYNDENITECKGLSFIHKDDKK